MDGSSAPTDVAAAAPRVHPALAAALSHFRFPAAAVAASGPREVRLQLSESERLEVELLERGHSRPDRVFVVRRRKLRGLSWLLCPDSVVWVDSRQLDDVLVAARGILDGSG